MRFPFFFVAFSFFLQRELYDTRRYIRSGYVPQFSFSVFVYRTKEGDIITKDIICVYWSANKARGTAASVIHRSPAIEVKSETKKLTTLTDSF